MRDARWQEARSAASAAVSATATIASVVRSFNRSSRTARLPGPVGEVGQLGAVRGPVIPVGDIAVGWLPADLAIVLLAEDVGVTGVPGKVVDHMDDDPLKCHLLPAGAVRG